MKPIVTTPHSHILRFDKDEDVIASLAQYCDIHKISASHFTGLGACKEIILSYYDLEKQKYLDKTFSQELEVVSLTGNTAKTSGKVLVHCHGVFSDKHYQTFGGHVKKLIVSATCEIHLTLLQGTIERAFDSKTGLNLMK